MTSLKVSLNESKTPSSTPSDANKDLNPCSILGPASAKAVETACGSCLMIFPTIGKKLPKRNVEVVDTNAFKDGVMS